MVVLSLGGLQQLLQGHRLPSWQRLKLLMLQNEISMTSRLTSEKERTYTCEDQLQHNARPFQHKCEKMKVKMCRSSKIANPRCEDASIQRYRTAQVNLKLRMQQKILKCSIWLGRKLRIRSLPHLFP